MRPVLKLIFIKIDNQIKINIMKKSQLRQIIREEISRVLNEQEIKISSMDDEKTTFEGEIEYKGVGYAVSGIRGKITTNIDDSRDLEIEIEDIEEIYPDQSNGVKFSEQDIKNIEEAISEYILGKS